MAEIKVYGTSWCRDCIRAKTFLDENKVDYDWTDVDKETRFIEYILEINDGERRVPTIVFPDGSVLVEPSNRELAKKLAMQ